MHTVQVCPLCAHSLLRHIRAGNLYWLCRRCNQEAPVLAFVADLPSFPKRSALGILQRSQPEPLPVEFSSHEHTLP